MIHRVTFLLYLDTAMLVLVCVLECLSLTGLEVHQWLGFAFCPVVFAHVVLQWQWFLTQFQRIRTSGSYRLRINALLNLILLFLMAAVLLSGVFVSRQVTSTIGESFGRVRIWSEIHGWANFSLIALVGLHLALNWDWITAALGCRRLERPAQSQTPAGNTLMATRTSSTTFTRALARSLAVLLVAALAAGAAYFVMAALTQLPDETAWARIESGTARPPDDRLRLAPRPRSVYLPHGIEQLVVTTTAIVLAAVIGRYVFRLRL